ncbi:teichoic acid transport system permease protein [Paenibacillus sp. cl6col]|uniref:Transport permease protein n=1 Tax=Paenibacillus alvei TaxID=44250 RepID=A0ABT4E4F9_PAEAL|nr:MULTISPECIES: ABC transporter permease [Paenibacillus]MCY9528604.1 ABC transporter permease [Paenibacillus alvei]SDG22328.1 teichoic acid transport system permease protein [Paenibacillus sp. cl6col]
MNYISYVFKNYKLILELSRKDIKSKYLGSFMGVLWAFVHPLISILVYWTVFQVGFKTVPVDNIPFVLWLLSGMVPWLFISESWANATNSITENSFLVKKIVFRVSVLPVIKIISSLFVHLFFILILFLMFALYGWYPNIYNIQLVYYLICSMALSLALSLISSTLIVFIKDVGQIVAVMLQLLFWLTPIFWNLNIVEKEYQIFFKVNPIFYIVEGYRDTFINDKWFWHHPWQTLYFWSFVTFSSLLGIFLYKKMRSHFADVL